MPEGLVDNKKLVHRLLDRGRDGQCQGIPWKLKGNTHCNVVLPYFQNHSRSIQNENKS